ncbi:MAG: hypothetical protein MK386_07645 [Candidatus Thioglobus autotrophicus]|nr:hypothetical protein [Candidatus Thioglobus autotrophicus]
MDKVKQWSWSEVAYKVDPELSAPVVTYKFNNGARVFYKTKRNGTRKSR